MTLLPSSTAVLPLPVSRVLKPEMGDHGLHRIRVGVLPDLVCGRTIRTVSPCPRSGRDWHLNPNSDHASFHCVQKF